MCRDSNIEVLFAVCKGDSVSKAGEVSRQLSAFSISLRLSRHAVKLAEVLA